MTWESAERVQKNDAGQFRAMIDGVWVPVVSVQTNDAGQFRVSRSHVGPSAAPVSPVPVRHPVIEDIQRRVEEDVQKGSILDRWGRAANWAGGKITDLLAPVVPPEVAAAGGVVGNLAVQAPPIGGAAAIGAKLSPLLAPLGVTKAIKSSFLPSPGEIAVKAAGPEAPAVIRALETTPNPVLGVNLTAGQAAVSANSPEIAALQQLVAEGKTPARYFGPAGIEGQQEAARRAAVQTIGKDEAALEAAKASRKATSDTNYQAAFAEELKRDKELRTLWKSPLFHREVSGAWDIFKTKSQLGVMEGNPPLKLKDNMTEFLDIVKKRLDARLQSLTTPGTMEQAAAKAEKKTIEDVKGKLLEWMDTRNTAYELARTEHAAMSKPIEQMTLGQALERALVAPGTEVERLSTFANAVRQAETKVSKHTGKPVIQSLSTAQRDLLDAIETNMKLGQAYKELARHGIQSLENRIGTFELPPTMVFKPALSASRGIAQRMLRKGHETALQKLAPIMEDPKQLAQIMRDASPQQRQYISSLARELVGAGSLGIATEAQMMGEQPLPARAGAGGMLTEIQRRNQLQ